jgi:hypothetical protein
MLKFHKITNKTDRKYDLCQQNSSTIRVVISQSPKGFACDTFMPKFIKSKREISLI